MSESLNHETPSWVWKRRENERYWDPEPLRPNPDVHDAMRGGTISRDLVAISDRLVQLSENLFELDRRLALLQQRLARLEERLDNLSVRPAETTMQRRPRDWGET